MQYICHLLLLDFIIQDDHLYDASYIFKLIQPDLMMDWYDWYQQKFEFTSSLSQKQRQKDSIIL